MPSATSAYSPSRIALERLPNHLRKFCVPQDYDSYTSRDQAVWRYVMRLNVHHLKDSAHESYLKGLKATGIRVDAIPSMDEMNRCLNKLGWSAVCVRGFIPPQVFMELQSMGVLAIAADIRSHQHVAYTPAPDIIHEAAGHAPIVYDPIYAAYLRQFGAIGMMAVASDEDKKVYEAIRHLSMVKEEPDSSEKEVTDAEQDLLAADGNNSGESEACRLTRMHWWTTEYGLVGDLDNPRIFGAGLLSSVGESASCLSDDVLKVPLSTACADQAYDITKTQPQLFVAEDFRELRQVLEWFAEGMAFSQGGKKGLNQAREACEVTTTVTNLGLQMTGTIQEVFPETDELHSVIWSGGPMGVAVDNRMILFASPLKRMVLLAGKMIDGRHPGKRQFDVGETIELCFLSGWKVCGTVAEPVQSQAGCRGLLLDEAQVVDSQGRLVEDGDGLFIGFASAIASVFGGPADREVWDSLYGAPVTLEGYEDQDQQNPTDALLDLYHLYRRVKQIRRDGSAEDNITELVSIATGARELDPDDWLLNLEILELLSSLHDQAEAIQEILAAFENHPQFEDFNKGLALLNLSVGALAGA